MANFSREASPLPERIPGDVISLGRRVIAGDYAPLEGHSDFETWRADVRPAHQGQPPGPHSAQLVRVRAGGNHRVSHRSAGRYHPFAPPVPAIRQRPRIPAAKWRRPRTDQAIERGARTVNGDRWRMPFDTGYFTPWRKSQPFPPALESPIQHPRIIRIQIGINRYKSDNPGNSLRKFVF